MERRPEPPPPPGRPPAAHQPPRPLRVALTAGRAATARRPRSGRPGPHGRRRAKNDRLSRRGTQPWTTRSSSRRCVRAVAAYSSAGASAAAGPARTLCPVQRLADEDVEAYLQASFYAARLSGKRFNRKPDEKKTLDASRDALARYRAVVRDATEAKASRNLPAAFFAEELKLCTEMISLLPAKLDHVAKGHADFQD